MTTITVELLPCPFCGERPELEKVGRDWWRIKHPHVIECLLDSIEFDYPQSDEDLACGAGDWNRRALLAEQPQAGAGQDVPDVVRQFVESQAVCSDCHLDETCCRPLLRAARDALSSAPQPSARHDQGDEVLRDAQRYRYMRAHAIFERRNGPGLYWYLPRNLTGGAANQLDQAIDAALTHSQQGAEE